MTRSALITGLAGTELSGGERAFLRDVRPCGMILFARNCVSHVQIQRLVAAAKYAIGSDDVLVLIDQEGGRVQRLRPPLGRALPSAAVYARIYRSNRARALNLARSVARLMAHDLLSLGINTDCAPVLDVPVAGAHDIIGDRAYGRDVESVVALGRAVADGFMAGGMLPVMKHIPGHGRATADSHLALPVVDADLTTLAATDFGPFRALADLPAAMTAHVVFAAIDAVNPASTSVIVTRDIIRGAIGFDGFLMSDDLGMHALSGPMRARAEAVIAAGSDAALHCSGDLSEMAEAAAGVPFLADAAARRFAACLAVLRRHEPFEIAEAESALAEVLGHATA